MNKGSDWIDPARKDRNDNFPPSFRSANDQPIRFDQSTYMTWRGIHCLVLQFFKIRINAAAKLVGEHRPDNADLNLAQTITTFEG